jgi:hypothetical protein
VLPNQLSNIAKTWSGLETGSKRAPATIHKRDKSVSGFSISERSGHARVSGDRRALAAALG